ncbi:MAG: ATP-binding protein [Lachnospiraceae bacterium]|nr:ATP-binding protein [Lachnospiraceae bacterium]
MIILICGKICSGKTWYTNQLLKTHRAICLSCDELMLTLNSSGLFGDKHDEIASRVQQYLLKKAEELTALDVDVILEWGFWTREGRKQMREYFQEKGIPCQWHYLDISEEDWMANIEQRNEEILAGRTDAYFMDEGLMEKLKRLFEEPDRDEMDVWYPVRREKIK